MCLHRHVVCICVCSFLFFVSTTQVFGLPPLVHTDDPTRAVLACFDMVKVGIAWEGGVKKNVLVGLVGRAHLKVVSGWTSLINWSIFRLEDVRGALPSWPWGLSLLQS